MTEDIRIGPINDDDANISRILNFFWVGYCIYVVSFSFPASTKYAYFICQGLQIIGFIIFLISAGAILKWDYSSNYLRNIFSIFLFWSFIVIIRGFQFNFEFIKDMLLNAWFGLFIYFAPLVLIFPIKIAYLKKVFNVIFILSIFYFIYDLLFFRVLLWGLGGQRFSTGTIEYFSHFLSIPSGFVLLTYIYHDNKKNLLALATIIMTFILASIRARRGLMFMSVTIIVASYLVFYFTNRGRILSIILSIFFLIFIIIYGKEVYSANRGGMFGLITGRVDEDTRTGVVDYFISSMRPVDWVIGRGVNGQYYCPGIDEIEGSVTVYRNVIETGYLQIILKGGLISLVLFLLMAIPAVIKGLFYSKNILSKAAAIWTLLFIIYLYPTTINGFTLNYLLIWFSLGICYSKKIRNMSNDSIKTLLSED